MLRKWFRTYQFLLAASAVFVWWLLRQPNLGEKEEMIEIEVPNLDEEPAAQSAAEKKDLKAAPSEPVVRTSPKSVLADDLIRIEGIGPKISSLLQEAGISTYAALAASSPEHLRQIMQNANLRLARPDTWPEQAALAAGGQWEELEVLQKQLKGGRKVQD